MKKSEEFLLEFENKYPRLKCEVSTVESRNWFYSTAQGAQITIDVMNEYALYILKEIFEDGLGKLDDNCSKDDLVEQYLEFKKMLK